MKLYAKVASERASEGQGGNEYLHIDIFGGSAKEQVQIGRVVVEVLPVIDFESREEYTKDMFDVEVIYVDDTQQVRYRAVKKVNTK